MSRILYAIPSFYNLFSSSHVERIDTFLRSKSLCGYTKNVFVLRDTVNDIGATLLRRFFAQRIAFTISFHQLNPIWDFVQKDTHIFFLCVSRIYLSIRLLHVVCLNSCDFIVFSFALYCSLFSLLCVGSACLLD
jgi:hypothetical protein